MHKQWLYLTILVACLGLYSAPANAEMTVGGGFMYLFQDSSSRWNLEPGPAGLVRLGYEWKILGLGGDFFYANMEHEPSQYALGNEDASLFGGTLDLKVKPMGMIDFPLQPYGVAGAGGMHMDSNVPTIPDAGGFLGKLGVGVDLGLGKYFSIGAELDWNPFIYPGHSGTNYFQDPFGNGIIRQETDDFSIREINFYAAMVNATFHF